METREIVVRAEDDAAARTLAVQEARRDLFDPLRVLHIVPLGVQDGPGGVQTRWVVQIEGEKITESEARSLWGDR